MEVFKSLNIHLTYAWIALENILSCVDDTRCQELLAGILQKKTLLEKKSHDVTHSISYNLFNPALNKDIAKNLLNNRQLDERELAYLSQLKECIESFFIKQLDEIEGRDAIISQLDDYIPRLEQILAGNPPQETLNVAKTNYALAQGLKVKVSACKSQDSIRWDEYSVFMLLKSYMQFFIDRKVTDNKYPDLSLYYSLYTYLAGKTYTPVFMLSNDKNIVISSDAYPDKIHLKVFDLMGLDGIPAEQQVILNSIDENFIENPLLPSIYAHEFGHLLDLNLLNVEELVVNNILNENPALFRQNAKEIGNWVREIIADAVAVCIAGPVYLYAVLNFFNEEEMAKACDSHPSLAFRANILASYLEHNGFLDCEYSFIKDCVEKVNEEAAFTSHDFQVIESLLLEKVGMIYQTIVNFTVNAEIHCSSQSLAEGYKETLEEGSSISEMLQYLRSKNKALLQKHKASI